MRKTLLFWRCHTYWWTSRSRQTGDILLTSDLETKQSQNPPPFSAGLTKRYKTRTRPSNCYKKSIKAKNDNFFLCTVFLLVEGDWEKWVWLPDIELKACTSQVKVKSHHEMSALQQDIENPNRSFFELQHELLSLVLSHIVKTRLFKYFLLWWKPFLMLNHIFGPDLVLRTNLAITRLRLKCYLTASY